MMILFPKICALVLTVLSARSDLKAYRIPNNLLLLFLSAALFYRVLMRDVSGIGDGLLGLLIPFVLLWAFYRLRKMGAGDIKLFCVLGAFMGPGTILEFMFCSFVCGGVAAAMNFFVSGKRNRENYQRLNVAVFTVPAAVMWAGGIYG